MLSDVGGGRLASILDIQSFFFIKENWICAMIKHAKSSITLLFYKNKSIDFGNKN